MVDVTSLFLLPSGFSPISRSENGYQVGCHGTGGDFQVSEVNQPMNLPEGITHYASAAIFYEREILPLNPAVVAWGEVHHQRVPQNPSYQVTHYTPSINRLANDLLPAIAHSGENTIQLEAIPIDRNVRLEIGRFFANPNMTISSQDTPLIWDAIPGLDRAGYILLFNRARDLGVGIIGGGLTIVQAEATIRRSDFLDRLDLQALAARWVTVTMREAAARQLRLHPRTRLHLHSGCSHNDRQATRVDARRRVNYGEAFVRHFGDRYVAVDLIYPHPYANCCTEGLLRTPRFGVNTRRNAQSSYTAFFPGN